MIFITLGSQKFQFNRLLKEMDKLIKEKKINDKVFAQIGYSDYKPQNFKYKKFIDREEFKEIIDESEIVIAHGGTGAIITAVKNRRKVIGIPRLSKYGEHVDNHQIQIVREFEESGIIKAIYEIDKLEEAINDVKNTEYESYTSNTRAIVNDIEKFIESGEKY